MSLGIGRQVHFHPPVASAEVSAAIRNADASLIAITASEPNYALSVPTKLLEAIAAGLPGISTRTPALAHFLAEYPIGSLWDADQPKTLAEAITRLENPDTRSVAAALQAASRPAAGRLRRAPAGKLRASRCPLTVTLPNLHNTVTK